MKRLLFAISFIIIITSCKKELLCSSYEFRQEIFITSENTVPVFWYNVAVKGNNKFEKVNISITLTLSDGSKININEGYTEYQWAVYFPKTKNPEYWVYEIGLKSKYNIKTAEIVRIDYSGQAAIEGQWCTLPSRGRKMTDPIDYFFVDWPSM